MSDLAAKFAALQERIQRAAERAGRRADEITLVAVTKTHPLETVIAAYQAGIRHFGENRAAEGAAKAAGLARWLAQMADPLPQADRPTWHLIGHLQSRQVSDALGVYQIIHSIDSLKLAERLNRLAERDNLPPIEVLLQANVSGEASKSGFALAYWDTDKSQWAAFLETITQISRLNQIKIRGLMTMAPGTNNLDDACATFRRLATLRQVLQAERPQVEWQHLSMGMSDDFEVAIEAGATIIRVGQAIFGARE
jgi:hypothetical protein